MAKKTNGLFNRRNAVIAGAAAVGGGVLALRESDQSGPRDPYFEGLQNALKAAEIGTPTLIIDKARLDANIDTMMRAFPQDMAFRIVAKSLPSLDLISHIRARTGTDRIMTFNLSMLEELSLGMADASQLLGKPLPINAAKAYLQSGKYTAQARSNVQWLIDDNGRLADYIAVANTSGQPIRVNIELDVGLHRGGIAPGEGLTAMLTTLRVDPNVTFSGFMGYEPHVSGIASEAGKQKELNKAWGIYKDALSAAREVLGSGALENATLNAAGSPTFKYYTDTSIANELAVGTALVKPNHYDSEILSDFVPSSFIASPVIKSFDETRMPGAPAWRNTLRRFMNPNLDNTIFVYGGNWMADPVDPVGIGYDPASPPSSNQEMLVGGTHIDLKRNDWVFYRPHQSEAVFLQFGDIAVFEDGKIMDYWPVFPATA
ncbi:MAG: alanine racemase [Pseudomonadota bacterium]